MVINGWTTYAHPLFLEQVRALTEQVERLKAKHPKRYKSLAATKRLAAVRRLAFEIIPDDPARPEFRLGDSLGPEHRHWFRAKFFQQYRLFFRYHAQAKIIVYAWINDEDTKRAYGDRRDAYRVFRRMLERGSPPDDWDALLKESRR